MMEEITLRRGIGKNGERVPCALKLPKMKGVTWPSKKERSAVRPGIAKKGGGKNGEKYRPPSVG